MFLQYNIKPILVFDGMNVEAKKETNRKRSEKRKESRSRVSELLRMGKTDEARKYMMQAVDVTHEMAFDLITECRKINVDSVVAPYESDAQLSYLNSKLKIADYVVTEDSDLVLFGCTKVLFKLDLSGRCLLLDSEKLHLSMNCSKEKYSFEKFRFLCIMSGCDYLDSLPGIGLAKALKFMSLTEETDPRKFLKKIPSYLNMRKLEVTDEYIENFMKADATFRYVNLCWQIQLFKISNFRHMYVYCPIQRKMVRLNELEDFDTDESLCVNAGELIDSRTAFQLALGNIDPHNLTITYGNFHPDSYNPVQQKNMKHFCKHPSIWSRQSKTSSSSDPIKPKILVPRTQEMEDNLFEVYKEENSVILETMDETDLISQYSGTIKPQKPKNPLGFFTISNSDYKNPFAKKTAEVKSPKLNDLSLMKKANLNPFNKFKKTVIDESQVVKSRFFKKEEDDDVKKSPEKVAIQEIRILKLQYENRAENTRKIFRKSETSSASQIEKSGSSPEENFDRKRRKLSESQFENQDSDVSSQSSEKKDFETETRYIKRQKLNERSCASDDSDENFDVSNGNLSKNGLGSNGNCSDDGLEAEESTKSNRKMSKIDTSPLKQRSEANSDSDNEKCAKNYLELTRRADLQDLDDEKGDSKNLKCSQGFWEENLKEISVESDNEIFSTESTKIEKLSITGQSSSNNLKNKLSLSKFSFKASSVKSYSIEKAETESKSTEPQESAEISQESVFTSQDLAFESQPSQQDLDIIEIDDSKDVIDVDSYQSKKSFLLTSVKSEVKKSNSGKTKRLGLSLKKKTDPAMQTRLTHFGFQKKPTL